MPYSLVSENVVSSAGAVFVVSASDGQIRPETLEGLYALDTRFLSEFKLTIDGKEPVLLRSGPVGQSFATFYAGSADGGTEQGGDLSIIRDRYVLHGMHEDVVIQNHTVESQSLEVKISLDADFADLFEVRRGTFRKTGESSCDVLEDGELRLSYKRGEFERETLIAFSPRPSTSGPVVSFEPTIEPRGLWKLCISVLPVQDGHPEPMKCADEVLGTPVGAQINEKSMHLAEFATTTGPLRHPPTVETIHDSIRRVYDRSVADLQSLQIKVEDDRYIMAAGIPWFVAVFGRDSIISAIQAKILGPELMISTLEVLASYQAKEIDEFREAQPGKIPHEIREGELSHFQDVPHSRYYGSVDATPLFVMLLAEAHRWIGDLDLIKGLVPAAEAALAWIDEFGDSDGDGFVEYSAAPGKPLRNQCWKDSGDSISFAAGHLAEGPIAVAEVQGYVYAAKLGMAEIYETLGDVVKATRMREEATRLKRQFDDVFWMPEEGFYAIAIDGDKKQVDSIASNPGHCLWSGILSQERAEKVAERLMAPDMFNGWGIRTLSSEMARYHPVSYHNGSVWPHDSSIIATGFARYGLYDHADQVIGGLFEAAASLPENRLPELLAGYPRRAASFPVPYPSANAPQAWAASAVPSAVEILLRLRPDSDQLVSDVPSVSRPLSLTGVRYRGRQWSF